MEYTVDPEFIETSIGSNYLLGEALPAQEPQEKIFKVYRKGNKQDPLRLTFQVERAEISTREQETFVQKLRTYAQAPSPIICSKLDHGVSPTSRWIISEFPGENSLASLRDSSKELRLDEIEAFIRLIATACTAAVQVAWPKLQLDPEFLFFNPRLGLPRISYPSPTHLEESGPLEANAYTRDLALLYLQLLPKTTQSSSDIYAHPDLKPHQRQILSEVLESKVLSLEEFLERFFEKREESPQDWISETLWNVTAKLPSVPTQDAGQILKPLTHLNWSHQIHSQPSYRSGSSSQKIVASKLGWIKVREEDVPWMKSGQAYPRLRLTPLNEETPVLNLNSTTTTTLGRSSMHCDFVTQFRPRTEVNDSRTLRISRQQSIAEWRRTALIFKDVQPKNPSTFQFQNLPSEGVTLKLPVQLSLAGEYPLEVQHLASDFAKPPQIDGASIEKPETRGAILFRACGAGVYLTECCMLFTDITLHFSDTGRPWFKGSADWDFPFARIHRLAEQFWIEPLQTQCVHLAQQQIQEIPLHELVHLTPGRRFKLGDFTYLIEEYSPTTPSA